MSLSIIDTTNWVHKHWNTDLEYVNTRVDEDWLCDGCGYVGTDMALSRTTGSHVYGILLCAQCGCRFVLTVKEAGNKTSMMMNKSMSPNQLAKLKYDGKFNMLSNEQTKKAC